jgi:hypothetical protein
VLVVVLWCIRLYIGGGGGVVVRDLRSGDDGASRQLKSARAPL